MGTTLNILRFRARPEGLFACFRVFLISFANSCNRHGLYIHYDNIVQIYLKISHRAMTKATIELGFRKTGIHPFNPHVFTKADFGPSCACSTQRRLPDSYPRSQDLVDLATSRAVTRGAIIEHDGRSLCLLNESEIVVASRSDLQECLRAAQDFIQRSHAHNVLADDRIVDLQRQLAEAAKKRNRKRGAVRTEARGLTSRQYLELLDQQKQESERAEIENAHRKAQLEVRQGEKRKRDAER